TCLTGAGGDFPSGLGGSGGAVLSIIDPNFRYLQDRIYKIRDNASFQNLGLAGALGISTCNGADGGPNGNGVNCGNPNDHKRNPTRDYVTFTAHTNIDVYLMVDNRGGTGPGNDPGWIFVAPPLPAVGWVDTFETL